MAIARRLSPTRSFAAMLRGDCGRMLRCESSGVRRESLFRSSCVALVATAMCFGIRAEIMDALATQFHLTDEQTGWIAGAAFWGFTVSMFSGGMLCDVLDRKSTRLNSSHLGISY